MSLDLADKYQFHDNLIHGISFVIEDFQSELHIDIDYITHWPSCPGMEGEDAIFIISKAVLIFCNVTDLAINIDRGKSGYTTSVSGICIDRIDHEKIDTTLRFDAYYKWEIVMSDGRSKFLFGASDMFLKLIGSPLSVNRQYLAESERIGNPTIMGAGSGLSS